MILQFSIRQLWNFNNFFIKKKLYLPLLYKLRFYLDKQYFIAFNGFLNDMKELTDAAKLYINS